MMFILISKVIDQQKVNLQYVNMRASVVPWIDILIRYCLQ